MRRKKRWLALLAAAVLAASSLPVMAEEPGGSVPAGEAAAAGDAGTVGTDVPETAEGLGGLEEDAALPEADADGGEEIGPDGGDAAGDAAELEGTEPGGEQAGTGTSGMEGPGAEEPGTAADGEGAEPEPEVGPETVNPEAAETPVPESDGGEGVYAGAEADVHADGNIASGSYENIEWVIDADGKLTVSGTGDYAEKTKDILYSNRSPWSYYSGSILSAEINVAGMTDASAMFDGCKNLKLVDMENFDTSSVTNMSCMFSDCRSLSVLEVGGFDTSSVTDMGFMFSGCSSLSVLELGGFDTSSVTDMGHMFYDCSSLSALELGGFDTSSVTDMGGMFLNCRSLSALEVGGFDTSSVIHMDSMFRDCISLSALEVGGFDTSSVTNMGYMFRGCGRLSALEVGGFDTSNVTNMAEMFFDCSRLSELEVGGFDTSNVTSMSGMFFGCGRLSALEVGGFDTSSVTTDMGSMLYGCNGLNKIKTPCNLSQSVALPLVEGTVWRLPDGTEITELPQNLDYSVEITRTSTEPEIEVVHVSTMEELLAARGSSKCIMLADGVYESDGTLTLYNYENLTIQAENPGRAELLSRDEYTPVVGIESCKNVKISGCILGHDSAYAYECSGSRHSGTVVYLADSREITITGCDLYGCGTIGVDSNGSQNVVIEKCVIRDCKYYIGSFYRGSSGIQIKDCIMSGNDYSRDEDPAFDGYNTDDFSGIVSIENGIFLNNYNRDFVSSGVKAPATVNCTFHDNAWDGQEPKEYGICLNGLTWQIAGDVLKLGYPLQFEDGTVIESTQEEPLPYSDSSLPWKKCSYQRIVKAWEGDLGTDEPVEPTALAPAVKYVPYDTALPGSTGQTYTLAEGTLPQGLSLSADGRITGVPAQSGTFAFTVQLTDGSGTSQTAGYTLEVNENTAANFDTYADPGYELTELVPDAYLGELPEEGSQLMVSAGAFEEFTALYLDSVMLSRGVDYTAESGSTRITILNQTLRRSGAGTHTLAMEFRTKESGTLKWAAQNVVIAEGFSGNGGNDTPPPQEGGNDTPPPQEGGDDNQGGGSQEDGADDQEDDGDDAAPVQSTAPTATYIVKRGDNLWKISTQFYGTGRNWRRIYTDNASVIRDPDRLHAGQKLLITLNQPGIPGTAAGTAAAPAAAGAGNPGDAAQSAGGRSYTVKTGDNLYRIAAGVYGKGGRWNDIYQANKHIIADPKSIYAGQVLTIPEP